MERLLPKKWGDVYCIPVLYVVISYLMNKEKVGFSFSL